VIAYITIAAAELELSYLLQLVDKIEKAHAKVH
jgi:hypothetical protein